MTDHLHTFNIAVKAARTAHARAVAAANDAYSQGYDVLMSVRNQALYNAAAAYRAAMNAAEQEYEHALDEAGDEPPF